MINKLYIWSTVLQELWNINKNRKDKTHINRKRYFSSGILHSLRGMHSNLEFSEKIPIDSKLPSKHLYVFFILSLSFITFPLNVMLQQYRTIPLHKLLFLVWVTFLFTPLEYALQTTRKIYIHPSLTLSNFCYMHILLYLLQYSL